MSSPIAADEEQALLARVRAGGAERRAAAHRIYELFRRPVLQLCLGLCRNAFDAEDALQETFVSIHKALPLFRGESRLYTWIFRIAVRAAAEVRSRRRPAEELRNDLPARRDAERELLARDEARRMVAAFDDLSAEHRTVLALFAIEGLAHAEIAEILGISEGTVWSRLHGARRALAEAMKRRPVR